MHWSGSWWHAGGMWVVWLAVLVLAGLAIYVAVRGLGKSKPSRESPEEILQKRLARGEIDRDEYERRLEDLRQV